MSDASGKKHDDNAVEEIVEELLVDSDAPANSDTRKPPQTIDGEPSGDGAKR